MTIPVHSRDGVSPARVTVPRSVRPGIAPDAERPASRSFVAQAVSVVVGLLRNIVLAASAATVAGFIAFVHTVGSYTVPTTLPSDAGIVALTGGAGRLETALNLLARGDGKRLLISGVHPDTRPADLAKANDAPDRLFACCVDLDFAALDTVGNARETVEWARRRKFRTLILVTSDWHMPRALSEIRRVADGVDIIPYAVPTPAIAERLSLSNSDTLRLLAGEFAKYTLSLLRALVPPA